MRELIFKVSAADSGKSALAFLKSKGFSQRMVIRLKHAGGITRGGEILRTVDTVSEGDEVRIIMEDEGKMVPNPHLKAGIAYEDEDVIVFDKPPFMTVHPSILHHDDTLGNLFAALHTDLTFRPIHRLDMNTSGLCVCAKNRLAAANLPESTQKLYYAIIDGKAGDGTIDLPIGRTEDSIIKRMVRDDGQPALTEYTTVCCANGRSLLKIRLHTGRTHQIRVHFSYIGLPLCGDDMYGGDCTAISRQALHCGEVSFIHPVSGERVTVTSPLPEDMQTLITQK